jgi:hypothetical protein
MSASRNVRYIVKELFRSFEELQEEETCMMEPKDGEVDALGALKDLMGTLVSGIKSAPALQDVVSEVISDSNQPLPSSASSPAADSAEVFSCCVPASDPRKGKRAVIDYGATAICKHSCDAHVEVMDPRLWSQLPVELLACVFARLSLPQIFALQKLSGVWSKRSRSSAFRQLWTEAHPRVFGIVGHNDFGEFVITAYDSTHGWCSKVWCFKETKDTFYQDILIAHDGGLVCFVPRFSRNGTDGISIKVGNPLTNRTRLLHVTPRRTQGSQDHRPMEEVILMQLVVDPETRSYRVLLVCRWRYLDQGLVVATVDTAMSYDSRTDKWSSLNSGFVFGAAYDSGIRKSFVFDASAGILWPVEYDQLKSYASLESKPRWDWPVIVKDRVVVLHEYTNSRRFGFILSEFALKSSGRGFKQVNSPMIVPKFPSCLKEVKPDFGVKLFASHGQFMLVTYGCDPRGEDWVCKIRETRLYDASIKGWLYLPKMVKERNSFRMLQNSLMCELKWEAEP